MFCEVITCLGKETICSLQTEAFNKRLLTKNKVSMFTNSRNTEIPGIKIKMSQLKKKPVWSRVA